MFRFPSPLVKLARATLAGVVVTLLLSGRVAGVAPIHVIPYKACPGQTILLRVQKAEFKDASAVSVTIADRPAPVVRVVNSETIEAMIPRLSPGEAPIRIDYSGKTVGTGGVTVIHPPLRRVYFRMDGNTVVVERTRPYNGEYDRSPGGGRRLSYDVFGEENGRRRFLYTGAIPYPGENTIEAFGPPGEASPIRVSVQGSRRFVIKIPYWRGTTLVKLYEAPETADLRTAQGRRQRKPIAGVEKGIRIGEKP